MFFIAAFCTSSSAVNIFSVLTGILLPLFIFTIPLSLDSMSPTFMITSDRKFGRVFKEFLELNRNLGLKNPCLSIFLNKLIQAFCSASFDRFRCYFLIITFSIVTTLNAISIVSHKFFAASRAETCTFFVLQFLQFFTSIP